ncbi:MAG: YbhB/YbcL family Raf kinase inhibitor-like protein [Acidobacteria bacterium]|nr:YbhB/YbcL family Raf kinase inhibitor-like protein [Acidobacteriota bacterium]
MKKAFAMLALIAAATMPSAAGAQARAGGFHVTSADVKNGAFAPAQIYNGFGCTGGNVSPQLSWTGAPRDTRSFVVTVYDPDAPTGSGFWHWVVIDIPASVTSLPTGASRGKLPAGAIETRTDFGAPGYGGPCPPAGDKPHRYVFTVHALKADRLDLDAQASGALVGFNVHMNSLGSATFTARYGR